jgi:ribonuclease HII
VIAPYPTLRLERKFWASGDRIVVGIDEVGRGSWAGPVTVAAVVPGDEHLTGIRDSKMLTPAEREKAAVKVRQWARAIGVGHASHEECDLVGMTEAQRRAANRALVQLAAQGFDPDRIVLDGKFDYLSMPRVVRTVVKGDQTVLSVAAASVVAKTTRDAIMVDESEHYPAYCFESNRGYPAPQHKAALAGYGPSAIHRRSWIFMDSVLGLYPGMMLSVTDAPPGFFDRATARLGERMRYEIRQPSLPVFAAAPSDVHDGVLVELEGIDVEVDDDRDVVAEV